jgi:hypothetical protein
MDDYLRDSVSYKKDVEGLAFTYRLNLYRNIRFMDQSEGQRLKCLLPCTALSVVKILEGLNVYDSRWARPLCPVQLVVALRDGGGLSQAAGGGPHDGQDGHHHQPQ